MSETFAEVLHYLVRDPRWCSGRLAEALRALTEAASRALNASRVSVWEMAEDNTGIRCASLYDAYNDEHQTGAFLAIYDCPNYFEAISNARVVDVSDAHTDVRTQELDSGYLRPLGIGALLDAPVLLDGQVVGVVCHEVRGGSRVWTAAECAFAASIGDLVALAYQSERRRQAEEALRRREEEMRVALSAARVADWFWDMKLDRIRWSADVGPLFGRERGWQPDDLDGYMALIHPDDRESVWQVVNDAMQGEGDYFVEHRVLPPDRSVRWVQCRGQVLFDEDRVPIGITGVLADHTEHRELVTRLARSERLESLGRLAGGVAHDFNNVLTAIMGSCELLNIELDEGSARDRVAIIQRASKRAAALTNQLLTFSRRRPHTPQAVDLSGVLASSIALLEPILGEGISLSLDAPTATWVLADLSQLEQVIINLAVNARDAMPSGGSLSFAVQTVEIEGQAFSKMTVTDTGVGIPSELLDRIFEPFFTTKAGQQGTGLGLATCHGIVHQYGGTISVESEEGRGTTFQILLPATAPPPSAAMRESPLTAALSNRAHILFLEDATDVAEILLEVLGQDGHELTHFSNGDEAIKWLHEGNQPTVLISDVVLEGARGTEVALVARRLIPDIPVLLITGYAPEAVPESLADVPMFTKPFQTLDIRRWLQKVVGARVGEFASGGRYASSL